MAILMNQLDAAHQILGVRVSRIALIVGSLLMGALTEAFLIALALLALILYFEKKLSKRGKVFLPRFLYKQLPTRARLYGGLFDSMVESYKTEWVK